MDAELGDYRAALAPWLELRQRNILDPAVQESLLAVPFAFGQLGANRQAADYYLDAIDAFNAEIGRMDEAIRLHAADPPGLPSALIPASVTALS